LEEKGVFRGWVEARQELVHDVKSGVEVLFVNHSLLLEKLAEKKFYNHRQHFQAVFGCELGNVAFDFVVFFFFKRLLIMLNHFVVPCLLLAMSNNKYHVFESDVVAQPLKQFLVLREFNCSVCEVVLFRNFEQTLKSNFLQVVICSGQILHQMRYKVLALLY